MKIYIQIFPLMILILFPKNIWACAALGYVNAIDIEQNKSDNEYAFFLRSKTDELIRSCDKQNQDISQYAAAHATGESYKAQAEAKDMNQKMAALALSCETKIADLQSRTSLFLNEDLIIREKGTRLRVEIVKLSDALQEVCPNQSRLTMENYKNIRKILETVMNDLANIRKNHIRYSQYAGIQNSLVNQNKILLVDASSLSQSTEKITGKITESADDFFGKNKNSAEISGSLKADSPQSRKPSAATMGTEGMDANKSNISRTGFYSETSTLAKQLGSIDGASEKSSQVGKAEPDSQRKLFAATDQILDTASEIQLQADRKKDEYGEAASSPNASSTTYSYSGETTSSSQYIQSSLVVAPFNESIFESVSRRIKHYENKAGVRK